MNRRHFLQHILALSLASLAPIAAVVATPALASGGVVVIGHPGLPIVDATTLQRLYTGRAIKIAGETVIVVNAPVGSALRAAFLGRFVQMDEERYRAYWTVRRHVGKGVPPREIGTNQQIIEFVTRTPGAVGYIDAAALRPDLNVIARD